MAADSKKENIDGTINAIEARVIKEIRESPKTSEEIWRFLSRWWCRHYNKPYKNQEVMEYTVEELLYEFYDIVYRSDPDKIKEIREGKAPSAIPTEEELREEEESWFNEMAEKHGVQLADPGEQERAVNKYEQEFAKMFEDEPEEFDIKFNK